MSAATVARARDEVEVVIPHFNRARSLRRTLASLRRQTLRPSVIVCDNGSTDETVAMLRSDFPWVGENLGFGAAVNRGLTRCSGELVVLLNNDAVAEPDLVERLFDAWHTTGAEMIAACLRMPEGPIESVGIEVDRSLVAYDVWWGRDHAEACAGPASEPLAPCAGAAAYERRALSAAGKNRLMGSSRARLLWQHGRLMRGRERLRGWLLDGITYAGQALIDRNLGAARGRFEAWRELRQAPRPEPAPELRELLVERSLRAGLSARLRRRRPPPASRDMRHRAQPPGARV